MTPAEFLDLIGLIILAISVGLVVAVVTAFKRWMRP